MKIQEFAPPKNESWEHFILKNVAVAYLRLHFGCTVAAKEVIGMHDNKNVPSGGETKRIADAVGIRIKDQWLPKAKREKPSETHKRITTVYCIEAKVSRSDFQSGYCIGGDLNYVITPRGLVDKGELYKGVGLIEVDFDELKFTSKWSLQGIDIVKRATSMNKNRGEKQVDRLFRTISKQMTLDSIRNNPWFYPGYDRSR